MGKVRMGAFSVSVDGYGAGPGQDLANPMGRRGMQLHEWVLKTEAFHKMQGEPGGERGVDNDFILKSFENVGAWILGRNMFGPVRGPWPDRDWKGWWGPNPPYHVPVFVLTHHPREPLIMEGGTAFHFVTGGAEEALKLAQAAARGKDVRIGGGVATIRQYLAAGLIDELHFALSPVFLGEGENLFTGVNLPKLGFKLTKTVRGENATHVVLEKPEN